MKSRILIIGSIAVVVLGVLFLNGKKIEEPSGQEIQTQKPAAGESREKIAWFNKQLKTMGAVEVEAVPISLEPDSNMKFQLTLNTHSVELTYDLVNIVKAQDDKGGIYKSVAWSGEQGGHHLSGELLLEPISSEAKQITLIINGIDNQTENFVWDI